MSQTSPGKVSGQQRCEPTEAGHDPRPGRCMSAAVLGKASSERRPLGPVPHPPRDRPVRYGYAGNPVSADPSQVGDARSRSSHLERPAVADALRLPRDNPRITPEVAALLPWALTTITAASPSTFGLFAAPGDTGPGAAGLLGVTGHQNCSQASAAELLRLRGVGR